jgi:poly(A) polymerase
MEQEELLKIRPDLDGAQVMHLLNLKPSREVGQAMDFLLELRLEQGPIGEEAAAKALLEWWAKK